MLAPGRYGYIFFHWYVQKPSQSPQLLIYKASKWESWGPDRFTSSGSGTDFILIIIRVEAEDAGVYYCQQSLQAPSQWYNPKQKPLFSGGPVARMCSWRA